MRKTLLALFAIAALLTAAGCVGGDRDQMETLGIQGSAQPLQPQEESSAEAAEPTEPEAEQEVMIPRTGELSQGIQERMETRGQNLQPYERDPRILKSTTAEGAPTEECVTGGNIECTFPLQATFSVQQEVNFPLTATGGSCNFAIRGTSLPQGLRVDAVNMKLVGKPQIAGTSTSRIIIEDIDKTNVRKTCSMEIAVAYKGEVTITALRPAAEKNPSWRDLYELSIPNPGPNAKLTWEYFGNTENVCGSATRPDLGRLDALRKSCKAGELPTTGTTVYVWRTAAPDPRVVLYLNGRVRSPLFAKPIDFHLAFEESLEEPGEGNALPANLKTIRTITGNLPNSGTDCDVSVSLCTDAEMTRCLPPISLGTTLWLFESGKSDTFAKAPPLLTSTHRFFRITLQDGPSCGPNADWLLQGIALEFNWLNPAKKRFEAYHYFNPCVNKWLAPGEHLDFSEHDVAVCATVLTAGEEYAGTDDEVRLMVKTAVKAAAPTLTSSMLVNTSAPGFEPPLDGWLPMSLDWADLNDFERASTNSYGDYVYNSNPFLIPPIVKIIKEPDKDGYSGWKLQDYTIYLFSPGIFKTNPKAAPTYKSKKAEPIWLEESFLHFETPNNLYYKKYKTTNIEMTSGFEDEIVDSIGGWHFNVFQ